MTLSSNTLRAVACAVIIIMAIPAGIVSFSAEATAQPDMDTDIRTETETTKQLNTLRTGYNHPGLSSPRAHAAIVDQSDHEAIDGSPGGIQITPADVTLAPGGSYTLAVTIPDKGKIDDATLDITLSGADATVGGVTTLVDEGGFKTADRTALTDKRVTYEADSLTIDDTVLLTVDVPDAATDTDTVVLEAEYRAGNPLNPLKDYHVDTSTQTTYDIAGTATTYDSLATRADARADLSEQYRKAYNSIRTGQTGDFEDIFARSMVEATTTVGVEIVIGKLTDPFKKVDAALTAKDAYDTTVGNGDGGTAGDVLTSLAPVISSFGEFDQVYRKRVFSADRTNTSLSQLAKHQRAEADAWRNRNRTAALKAIKKQQEAICVADQRNTLDFPRAEDNLRKRYPCVLQAAENQKFRVTEEVSELGQFFKSIKSYAREEQDYINTQLFPVAKLPSASVTTDQSHETIESELDSLAVGDQTTLEFTVTNGDAGLSANGYLSISHAQTLDIVQVTQTTGDTEEEFKRTDTTPGEKFATRNGNGRAESPLVDIVESYDQDESNTYEITVKREADGKVWLTYRSALSPVLTEEGIEDGTTFSRAPTSSDVETTDQQGWAAYRLSVTQDDEDDGDGDGDDEDNGGGSDPVNEPPEADAGGPYELREGNSLELDASGSSDPDGGSIVSDWTLIDGPGSLNGNTYSAPSSISDDTTARVKIEVTDNQGKSDVDTTVINLKPADPDLTPTADAGGPYSVEAGEAVNLDATGSSTPDGSIKKTEWERIDGPGSVSGSVYDAPASVSSDTTAEIKLTVTGSNGATDTDTAKINLKETQDTDKADFDVSITDTQQYSLPDSASSTLAGKDVLDLLINVENTRSKVVAQDVELRLGSLKRDSEFISVRPGGNESLALAVPINSVKTGSYTATVSSQNDSASTQVEIQPFFNVSIVGTNSSVVGGNSLEVTTEIELTVDSPRESQEIKLSVPGLGTESREISLDSPENTKKTLTLKIPTSSGDTGSYTATVSSQNDSASTQVEIQEPARSSFDVSTVETNSPVVEGDPLEVTVKIENSGDVAGSQEIELAVQGIGAQASQEISLNGGETTTKTLRLPTRNRITGSHTATVATEDDTERKSVEIQEPASFDVSTVETNSPVVEGNPLEVTVKIENSGDVAGSQEIELAEQEIDAQATQEVSLNGGETTTKTLRLPTNSGDAGSYLTTVATEDDPFADRPLLEIQEPASTVDNSPSLRIPAENALAVNGSRVYTIADDSIRVYNLDTRELITQYAAPDGTNQGLAYGDGSLWYSDADQPAYNGQLLELNPTTGEIRSRIDGLGYDSYGLAYGDGSLWAGEVTGVPNELKEYSPDGSELGGSDIEGPAGSSGPNGVAYFNGSLWIGASSDSGQALFELGTNGNLKRTVQERSPESESGFKALAGSPTALYGPDSSGNLSVLMSLPPDGDGDDSDELLSVPFKTSFETGLGGWTVNQRFRTGEKREPGAGEFPQSILSRGDGEYSDQYDGSVRLGVNGGPSSIGVARNTSGIQNGTQISAKFNSDSFSGEPGRVRLLLYPPGEGNQNEIGLDSRGGQSDADEVVLSGTVSEDYPPGTQIRLTADVWPGEYDIYVTDISAQVPQMPSPSPPSIPTPPDQTGVSTGDPHIITFDGLAYDFQAAGEFTLFEDSQSVEIQARQLPVTDSDRDATVNTAIATLVDGNRVMIDARSSTEPRVIVDGTPVRVTATDPVSVGDGMIFYEEAASRYTVVYPGDDEQINDGDTQLIADIVGDRLDITVHTAPSNHDSVQGLLGDIDSDTSNDIALSNGTVLAQPPTFDSLYGPFRTSWRVTDTTSLFYYDDGNGPETYYQSDMPTAPVTIEDFPDTEILTAREKAQNAGLKSGSVNFRNAVLDYLLTRESSYFDSAQRAPKTRASNLMVPNRSEDGDGEGVPIGSNVVVDGFEDKDLTEYNDVEAATVTATTSYDGDSAVVITDRNEEMFKQNGHYTGNRIRRDLADGRPDHLAGAVRIGSGSYNDLRLYWRNETGKKVVGINLDTYRSNFYYDGTAVADISSETWYYVEFVDLDWEDNTVSKIKVDDRVVASGVPFLSNADKIHNLTMSVNDAGTGSKAYFDEITILGEETETETNIDVTRMISSSEVSPGEKVTLTTEITGVSGSVSTSSTYEPPVASATIQSVTVNGVSMNPILSEATMNGTTVTLGDVGTGTDATVRITEELTVREETDVTHSITGNVTAGETTTEVDPVTVTVAEPQSVVDEYDTDNDGTISITELGVAGADFARGELTITELGRIGAEFAS